MLTDHTAVPVPNGVNRDPLTLLQEARERQMKRPEIIEQLGMSPTLNEYGFVFDKRSPILDSFIQNEGQPGKRLFEIGSGFGRTAIECLRRGVAEYVANDLCEDHLRLFMLRLHEEGGMDDGLDLSALKLLVGRVPEALPLRKDYFDAILIDKVIHFLKPEEIPIFFKWALQGLKEGGRLYLLTISPFISVYREKVLPLYLKRKEEGDPYPGYFPNFHELYEREPIADLPTPKAFLFFDLDELRRICEAAQFKVVRSYSLISPNPSDHVWMEVPPEEAYHVAFILEKPFATPKA